MGEGSNEWKTASGQFWWVRLVRYALALVVTVLAAVIVVMGLRLVLQPGRIEINISQSNVFVLMNETANHTSYSFRFYMEATNPSQLLFIYYRNITVKLFDTSPPQSELLAEFYLSPSSLSLSQKEQEEYFVYGSTHTVTDIAMQRLFNKDNKEGMIQSAVMELSGDLDVYNIKKGSTITYHDAKFNCQPVAVKSNHRLPEPSSKNRKADCLEA